MRRAVYREMIGGGLLAFLVVSTVGGQTLPPVPDLQLWLTADAGTSTTLDGTGVTDWIDQAHGHFFFNANDILPTYVADSGAGIPAIDFQRSSGFLGDFSSSAGSTIGDATIFAIARFDGYTHGSSSSSYFFSIDNFADPGIPNTSEHTLGRDQSGIGPDQLYHWRAQPDPPAAYGTNIVEDRPGNPFGDFNYYTAIFRGTDDGGGSINEMEAWINGSAGATMTPDVTHNGSGYTALPSETRIGLWTSNGSGLDGIMREVLIYNRVLGEQEITDVENYLAERSLSPVIPTLLLQVDRESGSTSLKNVSGASLDFSGYRATSDSETLDRTLWSSIAATYDQDSGGAVDPNNVWQESGTATDNSLEEVATSGFTTLAPNQEIPLGITWTPYFKEDVVLEFTDGSGAEMFAEVQFSGNGGQPFPFGDLDFNGSVDTGDWTSLINVYGSELSGESIAAAYGRGDLNSDGMHSLADIQEFRQAFLAAGGSLSDLVGSLVPEPSTCVLLFTVSLMLVSRCLRRGAARVAVAGSRFCAIVAVCAVLMSATHVAQAGLFDDVPSLSPDGQSKLAVHFNGGEGVTTGGGGAVTAWDGLDGHGDTVVTAMIAGAGSPTNITHNGVGVVFNEINADDDLHLAAPLTHSENGNWTIFWFGHYDSSNQNGAEGAGLYTYNLTDLAGAASGFNQQRDDGAGGFQGEIWTGGDGNEGEATSAYGRIDQFDDTNIVWRSVHTDDGIGGYSSTLFADGGQIGTVARGRTLPANSNLLIGAYDEGTRFNGSGYNHLGEIHHLIVFDGILSPTDNAAIESFLGPDLPTLQVNTSTGQFLLTGGEVLREINAYEILSSGNSFDGDSWAASNLDAMGVDAIGQAVGESWDTFDASSSRLTEAILLASSQFDMNRTQSLGFGYDTGVDARDLVFQYTSSDGLTRTGVVEYVLGEALPGDYNRNGVVDAADYVVWRDTLGQTGQGLPADGDNNGSVSTEDYAFWKTRFGNVAAASAVAAVPEPGGLFLLLVAATALHWRGDRAKRSKALTVSVED